MQGNWLTSQMCEMGIGKTFNHQSNGNRILGIQLQTVVIWSTRINHVHSIESKHLDNEVLFAYQ